MNEVFDLINTYEIKYAISIDNELFIKLFRDDVIDLKSEDCDYLAFVGLYYLLKCKDSYHSFEFLHKALVKGSTIVLGFLAEYYFRMYDLDNYTKYINQAMDKRNADAFNNHAKYLMIIDIVKYKTKIVSLLEIAIELGCVDAYYNLSHYYIIINNYDKAQEYNLIAIEKFNYSKSMTLQALIHESKKEYKDAFKYYKLSSKTNEPFSIHGISYFQHHAKIVLDDDIKISLLEKYTHNSTILTTMLAVYYIDEDGKKASEYLNKAFLNNTSHISTNYQLGCIYENTDIKKSIYHHSNASKLGCKKSFDFLNKHYSEIMKDIKIVDIITTEDIDIILTNSLNVKIPLEHILRVNIIAKYRNYIVNNEVYSEFISYVNHVYKLYKENQLLALKKEIIEYNLKHSNKKNIFI
jgi:TPR repeat protein